MRPTNWRGVRHAVIGFAICAFAYWAISAAALKILALRGFDDDHIKLATPKVLGGTFCFLTAVVYVTLDIANRRQRRKKAV